MGTSAEKLMRLSREWHALSKELRTTGQQVLGDDAGGFREQLDAAAATVAEALKPALHVAARELRHALPRRRGSHDGPRKRRLRSTTPSVPGAPDLPVFGSLTKREAQGAAILLVAVVVLVGVLIVVVGSTGYSPQAPSSSVEQAKGLLGQLDATQREELRRWFDEQRQGNRQR